MIKKTVAKFKRYTSLNIDKYCAALSFYFLISIGSLMFIISFILGFFVGREGFMEVFELIVVNFFGEVIFEALVLFLENQYRSFGFSMVSIIILLYSSTTGFLYLKYSLNEVLNVKEEFSFKKTIVERIKLFFLVIILISFLFIILSYNILLDFLVDTFYSNILFSITSNFFIIFLFFSLLYVYGVNKKIKFNQVYFASFISAILYLFLSFLFNLYYGYANDIVSIIIAFSLFVYMMCYIFLLGGFFVKK
ncbi:MAG: YhjD/YihY/BrkB family envelope integrity protein [Candidatus Woesearchaeota archaeon]